MEPVPGSDHAAVIVRPAAMDEASAIARMSRDEIEASAQCWGAREITLECRAANAAARAFYAQRGYLEVGRLEGHYRHRGHARDGIGLVFNLRSPGPAPLVRLPGPAPRTTTQESETR